MEKKEEIMKFVFMKRKNRRVYFAWKMDGEGNHSFYIETKRLIDFKKRHILKWNGVLSIDTFVALSQGFNLLSDDAEFMKAVNPIMGQFEKDKWKAVTNIDR